MVLKLCGGLKNGQRRRCQFLIGMVLKPLRKERRFMSMIMCQFLIGMVLKRYTTKYDLIKENLCQFLIDKVLKQKQKFKIW